MSKYVIADIHGEYTKLVKCIESINLTREDTLIFLGDYVDRGSQSYEVIEYLIGLANKYQCIFLRGNHDDWWYDYIKTGIHPALQQGGRETLLSYILNCEENYGFDRDTYQIKMPDTHVQFFKNLLSYYIDEELNLFVHGGFNRHYLIEEQQSDIFWWDRDLLHQARSYSSMRNTEYPFKIKGCKEGKFKEIFVGHTPVQYFDSTIPLNYSNIWVLDTGAGKFKDGTVTIMNVDTKEFKQF